MEAKQKLKDIFALIDCDGGGAITIDEVRKFVSALPDNVDDDIVRKAFDEQDNDKSGEIDEEEFCGLTDKLQQALGVSVEDMVQHFTTHCYKDLFDLFAEGATEVRMSDLRTLVESMGTNISGEDLRKLFLKYDEDGSGQIEFEEFIGIVGTIGEGIPISTLVHDFKEARQKAKERMDRLKGAFAEKEEEAPKLQKRNKNTPPSSVKSPSSHVSHVCPLCPTLQARIAELEAKLSQAQSETNSLREEMQSKESNAGNAEAKVSALEAQIKTLEEKLKKKDVRKKSTSADKENKELLSKCERLERQVAALQAAAAGNKGGHDMTRELMMKNASLEKQLEEYRNSDLGSLQTQLWALEQALEIRTRELNALRDRTQEFANTMERYDPSLAAAMRETVRELASQAEKEAMETLGESVDSVVRNRKAKRRAAARKSSDSSVNEEKMAAMNREIQVLEAENKRLQRLASDSKRFQVPPPQVTQHVMSVTRDDREIEVLKARHKEELAKKDKDLATCLQKLRNAQDAIVAAAGAGYENDVKLHQARRSLQYILDKGSPQRSPGSGSGSPSGSPRAQSPRPALPVGMQMQPTRSQSPRGASQSPLSSQPQYTRTMHVDAPREQSPQSTAQGYSSPVRGLYGQPTYAATRTAIHSPPPPPAAYQSPVRRYA
eukprot:TRINITY_DN6772_c0_g1_i1.p1 TRINITY_DN6772_c0_g1~~TRINITY_DN6772_c0_g1_i1.p1  ORF type:complete len:663 (+),score=203.26 TRINITY_DN6772_c0_g1_i1:39-2027(+)